MFDPYFATAPLPQPKVADDFAVAPFPKRSIAIPYASSVWSALPFPKLALEQPYEGAADRADFIMRWLLASNFASGRIWAIPKDGTVTLQASLRDITQAQDALPPWKYHVSAFARTENANGIAVFDPILFNQAVTSEHWTGTFDATTTDIIFCRPSEAPRFGAYGSPMRPELAQEHFLDDEAIAYIGLTALKNDPAETPFRSRQAPRHHAIGRPPMILASRTLGL